MKHTRKNKKTLKKFVIPAIIAVLIILAAIFFIIINNSRHETAQKATTNTSNNSTSVKKNVSTNTNPEDNAAVDKTNDSNDTTVKNSGSLSDQIVSAVVNNGNIHVGTLVNGTTSGTCALSATQGQQTVALGSADVRQEASNYDCGVFNISTSELPSSGSWQFTLTLTSSGSQAVSSTKVTV